MNARVLPGALSGRVSRVIASKSQAHRAMLCAALSRAKTRLLLDEASKDVRATARCLAALGAKIAFEPGALTIEPIETPRSGALLDCGESGSTLRFLLPLVAALGVSCALTGQGLLAARPLSPLYEQLASHGARLSPQGAFPLTCQGALTPGAFEIAGDVSSQFITGLLIALPLLPGDSAVRVTGRLESAPYVALTHDMLRAFSVRVDQMADGYFIPGGQTYATPGALEIEGDWSSAAFWLAAGALGGAVTCGNLRADSAQGDRAMGEILSTFGATLSQSGDCLTARHAKLRGIEWDAADTPDLVPIISVVAGAALGDTILRGVHRLRLKESDRIESTLAMLRALGVNAEESGGVLTIHGRGRLAGGTVDACNDHRIAMAAAIAGSVALGPVTILGAEACQKSYPGFFEQFAALGGRVEEGNHAVNLG